MPTMNRRNFFQTVLAGIGALFLPKSKVDPAVGEDKTAVVVYDNYDGRCFPIAGASNLSEDELLEALNTFKEGARAKCGPYERCKTSNCRFLAGQQWGLTFPKENQNG